MANDQNSNEFSGWRQILWPIHAYELKKIVPLLMIFFCISFNYTVLRDMKDSLVVTASTSGAAIIPYLKLYGTLPAAIIFMLIFTKVSNYFSRENLFYVVTIPFLIFFALFAIVLYPMREAIHPTTSADYLASILPEGLTGLIEVYRNWSFSLFYIMAELWGSAVLSLSFWGFINQITRVSEAKRFYAMLGIGANIALLFSGPTITYLSNIRESVPADVDAWGLTINYLVSIVVTLGIVLMVIFRWMNTSVLTDPRFYNPDEVKKKKKKAKMGMMESLLYLAKNKYILCLAILPIAYGMSINLVEVTWKQQLKLQYPNPNDYLAFMGRFSTITGAMTIFMMLFVGGNVIRMLGWGAGALATPLVLLVTGAVFFSFIMFGSTFEGLLSMLNATPLFIAVWVGCIQNVLSKSTKYSLFDPTKEMAYIPLSDEEKMKGKAAVDVVAARLGKSGGAATYQVLLVFFGSIAAITPYVAMILGLIFFAWLGAIKVLSRSFKEKMEEMPEEAA